ncbi:hypothetical protein KY334_06755, partial [Candidatus Woesearchaeota archaeon]|nr:hypothetical protein [Candidatus Woesearchaeota archaeon]
VVPGMVLTAYTINDQVHKVLKKSKQAKLNIQFKKPLLFIKNGNEVVSEEFNIERTLKEEELYFKVQRDEDEILNISIKPNEYEHFEVNEKNPFHLVNDLNAIFYKEQVMNMRNEKYSLPFPGEESIFALGAGAEVFSYILKNPNKQKKSSEICNMLSELIEIKEYDCGLCTDDCILMPEKSVLMYDSIDAIINPIKNLNLLRYELLDMNYNSKGKSGKGNLEFKIAAFYGKEPSVLYSAKLRVLPLELLSRLKSF